jgi:hypothetical protein
MIGGCGGCHMFLDSHEFEKIDFFVNLLGQDRVDILRAAERYTGKTDLEWMVISLEDELEKLLGGLT